LLATPVTLKQYFDQDEALVDIGGAEYLSKLATAAATIINIKDYSQMIYELAIKRSLIGVGEEVVNTAYSPDIDVTAQEQIEAAEQHLFNLATDGDSQKGFKALKYSLVDAINRAESAYKNRGHVVGVSTGLQDLDKILGGLQKSDLLILAGRPSMGKTALATNVASNAAEWLGEQAKETGETLKSVGFFSLEMSAEQLATRLLASVCNIGSSKLMKGELTNEEFAELVKGSHALNVMPMHIDDTPALSISAIRTRARRLKRTQNVGLIVVDYLQLIRPSQSVNHANRVMEVSEITQGLKAIAKELDVPVIALSQLSRAVEQRPDKRPQLSDLRESGSIEQDADVVMFVYREEYYVAREQPREGTPEHVKWQENMNEVMGLADVIIAKQRNGPIGNVRLQFTSEITKFSDYIRDDHLPAHHN
jgi:replicative DNA helicase